MKLLEYSPPAVQPGPWRRALDSDKSLLLFGPRNRIREFCLWLTSPTLIISPSTLAGGGEAKGVDGGAIADTGTRGREGRARTPGMENVPPGGAAGGNRIKPWSSRGSNPGCWRRLLWNRKLHRVARFVFQTVQVVAVVATLVVVALDAEVSSGRRAAADRTSALRLVELAAVSAFLVEALVLIVARGLILLTGAYLRDSSNVFCFSLTALSAVCLWAFEGSAAGGGWRGAFWVTVVKVLRALHVFRLLRLARLSQGLTNLLNALRSSGKALCLAGAVVLSFWVQWAIVGLQVPPGCPSLQ